jgi:ABC-2 type transport system permease protein
MFYGLFLGASYMSGSSAFGQTLDSMVVGYTAWVLVNRSFAKTAQSIESEAATGVLESIFLSRFNTSFIYVLRGFVEATIDMAMIVILIVSIVFLTNSNVSYTVAIVYPILTILFASIGCSLMAGGFALQWKRISAILPSFQFVLMFLMFAPFEAWYEQGYPFVVALPMVPSVIMMRELMVYDVGFNPQMALMSLANGAVYLIAGAIIFHKMTTQAKNKGLVGGY